MDKKRRSLRSPLYLLPFCPALVVGQGAEVGSDIVDELRLVGNVDQPEEVAQEKQAGQISGLPGGAAGFDQDDLLVFAAFAGAVQDACLPDLRPGVEPADKIMADIHTLRGQLAGCALVFRAQGDAEEKADDQTGPFHNAHQNAPKKGAKEDHRKKPCEPDKETHHKPIYPFVVEFHGITSFLGRLSHALYRKTT